MSATSEFDAAYFTLLRAIDERDALLRYRDYLADEVARLDGFSRDTSDGLEQVARRVRKPVEVTTKPLLEAVGRRRAVVLDERARIDERIAGAEDFVAECEAEVAALRG